MKKILLILAALVLLLVAVLVAVPLLFEDQIKDMVKKELGKRVLAMVDFEDVGLSLLRHFPDATITIDDLRIVHEKEPFAGDTLLVLSEFEGSVNLFSLIGGGPIEIASIHLKEPRVNLRVRADGRANWQIMAETPAEAADSSDTAESRMQISVQEYGIRHGYIRYQDEADDLEITVRDLSHQGSGNFDQKQFTLSTRTDIASLSLAMAGTSFLQQAKIAATANIEMDLDRQQYRFADNEVRLNDLALSFAGQVGQVGDGYDIDLSLSAPAADLKSLLSMIPYVYQQNFEDLEAEGSLGLQGRVDGLLTEDAIPEFEITASLQQGRLRYSQMPTALEKVGLNLQISNKGRELDDTRIQLDALHFEIAGNPVDLSGLASTPVSDPHIDLDIRGDVDLGAALGIIPLEKPPQLVGKMHSELKLKGSIAAARRGDIRDFTAAGSLAFVDVAYESEDLPDRFSLSTAEVTFSPQRVTLDKFESRLGESDLRAGGLLENVVGFLFADQPLKGTLRLESRYFDLDPWLQSEGGGIEAVELPADVEFLMQAEFDQVKLEELLLSDVTGRLQLKERTLSLLDLNMNGLKGSITANGSYRYIPPGQPHLFLDVNAANLSIAETFANFVTVREFAPIAEHLVGDFSGRLNIDSDLTGALMPVWQDFFSQGVIAIPRADLQGFVPLNKVAEVLQLKRLENPTLQELQPSYLIEGGRFNLKPVEFSIGDYRITALGSNGLDKTVDYTMKIQVPAAELKTQANSLLSQLIGKEVTALTAESVVLDVSIGGTLSNPTVNASLAETIEGATGKLEDAAAAEIDKQKLQAEKEAQEELDRQKQELEQKKKEAEEKLKDKLKDLFKKP